VSEVFWQAKILGLLYDPALKALHNNSGRGENSFWQETLGKLSARLNPSITVDAVKIASGKT
jgi:hypothetical protein